MIKYETFVLLSYLDELFVDLFGFLGSEFGVSVLFGGEPEREVFSRVLLVQKLFKSSKTLFVLDDVGEAESALGEIVLAQPFEFAHRLVHFLERRFRLVRFESSRSSFAVLFEQLGRNPGGSKVHLFRQRFALGMVFGVQRV